MSTVSKPKPALENKASWNPWLGVLMALVALFGSQLVVVWESYVIIGIVKHWSLQHASIWLSGSIAAQFVLTLLYEIATVVLVVVYVRRYKGGLRSIGYRKPKWLDPLWGVLAFPAYIAIYMIILGISTHIFHGINVNEKQQLGFNNPKGTSNLIFTFVSLVILPPIAEETVFRGLILTSLKKKLPMWGAVLGTCLLFAAPHLLEGGSAGPLYIAGIDTFSLSLVLIYLREKTGGLYSGMVLHALKNSIAFVALFAPHLI